MGVPSSAEREFGELLAQQKGELECQHHASNGKNHFPIEFFKTSSGLNKLFRLIGGFVRLLDKRFGFFGQFGSLVDTGVYKIIRSAYSIDFVFEKDEDFQKFISKVIRESPASSKNTVGLSYAVDSIPVTATSHMSKDTLKHEQQHKKFSSVAIDTILCDSKLERNTKDEILAFYSENERADLASIVYILISTYKFHEEANISEDVYKKTLNEAIEAIAILERIFDEKQDVIALLQKENIYSWKKIAERIITSPKIQSNYR